jgi:hypothetical protein
LIKCSISEKIDKNLVKQFNEEFLKSYVKEDFVLLIDSWNGHKDYQFYENAFDDINCYLLVIS